MGVFQEQIWTLKTGAQLLLRMPRLNEAAQILELATEVASSSDQILSQPEDFRISLDEEKKWMQHISNDSRSLLLIAEIDGELIALLSLEAEKRLKTRHLAELGMSVRSDWRGQGVGRVMLKSCLEWVEKSGLLKKVNLSVFATNAPAISLYQSLGFVEEGRRKNHYCQPSGILIDQVLMAYHCNCK